MKKLEFTCCICEEKFTGWGNDPFGALDHETLKVIDWDSEHVCCDKCNGSEVLPGRMLLMNAAKVFDELDFKTVEEGLEQLRSLRSSGSIGKTLYDFILANWDRLTAGYFVEG